MTQTKFIRDRQVAHIVNGRARAPHSGGGSSVCAVWNHGKTARGFDTVSEAVTWLTAEGYKPYPFGA